ncbi:MAG TPA: hypothetical protein VFO37_11480 [Chitinophagaceae bacterium]|jgi:hypothetical protein|nr:hypothetical protein [Chitinophagaceae bacterium]
MHELINKLAFSLFRKNSLEECSAEEIEDLAKQYPYFSSAQLLLSAKQKQINHQDFEKQLLATSLHVNNPLWLNHLLNSKLPIKEKITVEEKTPVAEVNEEPFNDELVLENPRHGHLATVAQDEKINVTPLPSIIKKVEDKDQSLVFEPYYTVDYFASQGIKNVIEEKPKDRFSQQLKSFTEWLKTIRQMPPHQIAAMTDGGSEEKVVQLATNSLEEKDVDTEAMAEVWIKQGHPEKAAEIYQKLSLLNPSKSSYFAVLIEKLKKN